MSNGVEKKVFQEFTESQNETLLSVEESDNSVIELRIIIDKVYFLINQSSKVDFFLLFFKALIISLIPITAFGSKSPWLK